MERVILIFVPLLLVFFIIVMVIGFNNSAKQCQRNYGSTYSLQVHGSQELCVSTNGDVRAVK